MLQICNAVNVLHSLRPGPVIHRDLTPGNIMLTEAGRIKIVDFNTARYFNAQMETDTIVIGTKEFAAPEQYGFRQTDVRTDLYTLGVLFHFLLTGDVPGKAPYSGPAARIIRKCTRFEPSRRYQSVTRLAGDIRKLCSGRDKEPGLPQKRGGENGRVPCFPPGFRTRRPWKMVLAAVGYLLVFWTGLTIKLDNSLGIPAEGAELAASRMICIIAAMAVIFLWTDYGDIHRCLPLMKRKGWKIAGYFLYTALIVLALVLILYFCGI